MRRRKVEDTNWLVGMATTRAEQTTLLRYADLFGCSVEDVVLAFARYMMDQEESRLAAFEKAKAEGKDVSIQLVRYGRLIGLRA